MSDTFQVTVYKQDDSENAPLSERKCLLQIQETQIVIESISIDLKEITFAVIKLGTPSKKPTFASTPGLFLAWGNSSLFIANTPDYLVNVLKTALPPGVLSYADTRDGACVLHRSLDFTEDRQTVFSYPCLVGPAGIAPCYCITASDHADTMHINKDPLPKDAFSHLAWSTVTSVAVLVGTEDVGVQLETPSQLWTWVLLFARESVHVFVFTGKTHIQLAALLWTTSSILGKPTFKQYFSFATLAQLTTTHLLGGLPELVKIEATGPASAGSSTGSSVEAQMPRPVRAAATARGGTSRRQKRRVTRAVESDTEHSSDSDFDPDAERLLRPDTDEAEEDWFLVSRVTKKELEDLRAKAPGVARRPLEQYITHHCPQMPWDIVTRASTLNLVPTWTDTVSRRVDQLLTHKQFSAPNSKLASDLELEPLQLFHFPLILSDMLCKHALFRPLFFAVHAISIAALFDCGLPLKTELFRHAQQLLRVFKAKDTQENLAEHGSSGLQFLLTGMMLAAQHLVHTNGIAKQNTPFSEESIKTIGPSKDAAKPEAPVILETSVESETEPLLIQQTTANMILATESVFKDSVVARYLLQITTLGLTLSENIHTFPGDKQKWELPPIEGLKAAKPDTCAALLKNGWKVTQEFAQTNKAYNEKLLEEAAKEREALKHENSEVEAARKAVRAHVMPKIKQRIEELAHLKTHAENIKKKYEVQIAVVNSRDGFLETATQIQKELEQALAELHAESPKLQTTLTALKQLPEKTQTENTRITNSSNVFNKTKEAILGAINKCKLELLKLDGKETNAAPAAGGGVDDKDASAGAGAGAGGSADDKETSTRAGAGSSSGAGASGALSQVLTPEEAKFVVALLSLNTAKQAKEQALKEAKEKFRAETPATGIAKFLLQHECSDFSVALQLAVLPTVPRELPSFKKPYVGPFQVLLDCLIHAE